MAVNKRGHVGWKWYFVQYIPAQLPDGRPIRYPAGLRRMPHMPHMRNMPYHDEWFWFPRAIYPAEGTLPKQLLELPIWLR